MRNVKILLSPEREDTEKDDVKYSNPNCSTSALLQTESGINVVFDTGAYGYQQKLIDSLGANDLSPENINYVFLSHAHFDHNANIYLFKKAKLVYDRWIVNIDDGRTYRFGHSYHDIPIIEELSELEIIKTPGHTDDSQSIFFTYESKRYGLVGDAIKKRVIESGNFSLSASNPLLYKENVKLILSKADILISGDDGVLDESDTSRLRTMLNPY